MRNKNNFCAYILIISRLDDGEEQRSCNWIITSDDDENAVDEVGDDSFFSDLDLAYSSHDNIASGSTTTQSVLLLGDRNFRGLRTSHVPSGAVRSLSSSERFLNFAVSCTGVTFFPGFFETNMVKEIVAFWPKAVNLIFDQNGWLVEKLN